MPSTDAVRLDQLLVNRGLLQSRHRAGEYVKSHGALVEGQLVRKPGRKFPNDVAIALPVPPMPWVSRGALKLLHAYEHWNLNWAEQRCLDVGASTGGFTEVLLHHGAAHVVAVDTGTDQLAPEIRSNERVSSLEQTDIRNLTETERHFQFFTCDVSFISLRLVLPTIRERLTPKGQGIALIKPQFEVGREGLGRGGIVRNEALRMRARDEIIAFAEGVGFRVLGAIDSPIVGGDGNREYLLWLALSAAP